MTKNGGRSTFEHRTKINDNNQTSTSKFLLAYTITNLFLLHSTMKNIKCNKVS